MKRWKKIVAGIIGLIVVAIVAVAVVIHLPAVQKGVFTRVSGPVFEATGIRLNAGEISFQALPPSFSASNIIVDAENGRVLTVDHIRARWSWSELLGSQQRIESIVVENPLIDLTKLPPPKEESGDVETSYEDLLSIIEIGSFELSGGRVGGSTDLVAVKLSEIEAQAGLAAGRAFLNTVIGTVDAIYDGRSASLGTVTLEAQADPAGFNIERFEIAGPLAGVTMKGSYTIADAEALIEFGADFGLEALMHWLVPEFEDRVQFEGRLELNGRLIHRDGSGIDVELESSGPGFSVAGFVVDEVHVASHEGSLTVDIGGSSWGRVHAMHDGSSSLEVSAQFDGVPLDQVAALGEQLLPPMLPMLPKDLELGGTLVTKLELPFDVNTLSIDADVQAHWSEGHVEFFARGGAGNIDLSRVFLSIPGAVVKGSGSLRDQDIEAGLEFEISNPGITADFLAQWAILPVSIAGGPVIGSIDLRGTMTEPLFEASFGWMAPRLDEVDFARMHVEAVGGRERIEWRAEVGLDDGCNASAEGQTQVATIETSGTWNFIVEDIADVLVLVPPEARVEVAGAVAGEGRFAWGPDGYQVDGHCRGKNIVAQESAVETASFDFEARSDGINVSHLDVHAFGGRLGGDLAFGLNVEDPVSADLKIAGLDLGMLGFELPPEFAGLVDVGVHLSGTVAQPVADMHVAWSGKEPLGALQKLEIQASLADGVVRFVSESLESAAGSLLLKGQAPLGDVPRPLWLWPDAPGGALEIDLRGVGLRPSPLIDAIGFELDLVELGCDLELALRWDFVDPQKRIVDLELDNVSIDGDMERLVSSGPIRANLRGSEIVIEPLTLVGRQSRIEMQGRFDIEAQLAEARCDAVIDEEFARLFPIPAQVYGPVTLALNFSGPIDQMAGEVRIDHVGGAIVMRDPPVEISDLRLDIGINSGVIDIRDGRASVNRGKIEFGGGWDPEVGQGVVIEITDVAMLLPMGILSRWDGEIAIEPDDEKVSVAGFLELDGGYWDQPFDYSAALFGGGDRGLAGDDPLHDVNLDLEIVGQNGISVRNNLGSFDVVWKKFHVGGTAAVPLIEGELRIPYGGQLTIAGGPITVQRATVELVGDPNAPPRIEIVPVANAMSITDGGEEKEGGGFDATAAVTNALASSIGSALGLENETLQPAEIAIETEKNPGQQFAIGQRLSRNLALILSTNLSDVQDRTTMLQLWNIALIPGLALQAFQETADDVRGFAAIERMYFGGSLADELRPKVHKIKIEGDWPVSKWKLKRACGVSQGQAYDPFLLFAAGVRLERELAGYGYHQARVHAEARGDSRFPAMVFRCDPGPYQPVVFSGERLPKKVRRSTAALYAEPPLEDAAMENMRLFVEGHLDIKGYPDAVVSVSRSSEIVEVHIDRDAKRIFEGPKITGLPEDVSSMLESILSDPTEMAGALENAERVDVIIRRQLISRGYFDVESVRISSEILSKKSEMVYIEVKPGPRAEINEVRCLGKDPLAAFEDIWAEPGKPLDRWLIDRSVIGIRRHYEDRGYSDAEVILDITSDEESRWIVTFNLEPGVQRRVTKVVFDGHRYISENVLRSGLMFEEMDIFDPDRVDLSASQIAVFAPVERLEVRTRPEGVDGAVVEYTVTEKPRWSIGLGLRHRSDRGFEALFDLADRNLFGRGFGVNLRGRWGRDDSATFLFLSLPKKPGGRINYTFLTAYEEGDVERLSDIEDLQREQIKTISAQAAFEIDASSMIRSYLTWKSTRTFLVEQDDFFPIDDTIEQITPGFVYIRDRFDNPFYPRHGYYFANDLSYTTELTDSEHENIRNLMTGSIVLEPFSGWTWHQSLRLGIADPLGTRLTRGDRFYAGGQASIRGFRTDFVGPTYELNSVVYAAGGGALFILNEEIHIPVWQELRLAVFADIGQVWEDWSSADTDFSIGLGLGLRYATPIGPVYGDIAWPVANRGVSSGIKYYLGIGKTF